MSETWFLLLCSLKKTHNNCTIRVNNFVITAVDLVGNCFHNSLYNTVMDLLLKVNYTICCSFQKYMLSKRWIVEQHYIVSLKMEQSHQLPPWCWEWNWTVLKKLVLIWAEEHSKEILQVTRKWHFSIEHNCKMDGEDILTIVR